MSKDYYQILGVSRTASDEEINKVFKKLARKYHPDMNQGDKKAEDRFKEISEANEVLSNKEKRKKYDAFGSADFEGFSKNPFQGDPFQGGRVKYSTHFDMDDLGDLFGDVFGAGMGSKRRGFGFETAEPRRGKDLVFSIPLDFLEAVQGCEKKIRLSNHVTFNVKIPPGVDSTDKIRLAEKGEPGLGGGPAGDLYIQPQVEPHPCFRRNGFDIELDLPLTLSEALTGTRIKVPTIDGEVELKIPAGSQSGQKLRLKGKGIHHKKTKTRGDQYVILQIRLPQNLDARTQKELLSLLEGTEKSPRNF